MTAEATLRELDDVLLFDEEKNTGEATGMTIESVEKKKAPVSAVEKATTVIDSAALGKQAVAKLRSIEKELNAGLLEREDEIRSLILGLASEKNVLLLGPPGTGKSMLSETFSKHITKANYFQWLLSRTSDPSEILGPISVKAMENDQFLRKPNGKLPEAHVAFIDEIFKSNSATLNTLLPIANERIWYNDGVPKKANLKLLIGASNEFPEDDELSAFYDRFLFRHWIEYVGDSQNQATMLRQSVNVRQGGAVINRTTISLEEIEAVNKLVNEVIVPDGTILGLQKLIFELKKKDINVSDRRINACLHIMQANAAISGRTIADPDDMEPLAYVLWERKEDIEEIQAFITKMMNPFKDKVNTAYKEAESIQKKVMAIQNKTDRANQAIDARNVLDKLAKRIKSVVAEAEKEGRDATEFRAKMSAVEDMNKEIVHKCLLFSMDDDDSDDGDLPF